MKVFDKIAIKIKERKRYNCDKCKDTGYIEVELSPLDNNSINTFFKDVSLKSKVPCSNCKTNTVVSMQK